MRAENYHVIMRDYSHLVVSNASFVELDAAKSACENNLAIGNSVCVVESFPVGGVNSRASRYIIAQDDETWDEAFNGITFTSYRGAEDILKIWQGMGIAGRIYGIREIPMKVNVEWSE